MFKKLTVPTNKDKKYLLKYRTYSSLCFEGIKKSEKKPFNYKTMLCKFFLVNSCTKGEECGYSHDTSQFPCKAHFERNNCKRKNCLFSHDPSTLDKIEDESEPDCKLESPFL